VSLRRVAEEFGMLMRTRAWHTVLRNLRRATPSALTIFWLRLTQGGSPRRAT
jgi:hypothetical protein